MVGEVDETSEGLELQAIQGWNEAMITYILAISSPTHNIPSSMYDTGWARNGLFEILKMVKYMVVLHCL